MTGLPTFCGPSSQAEAAGPDLIGAQEAALWQTGAYSASYPPPPPATVSYDFVKILVNALAARGLHYAPVAVTSNFTVAGPGLFPSGFRNVQLTDRVAILARTDIPLTITDAQTGNFTHNAVLDTFQGPITLTGGWAAVDATLGGHTIRFVTTHLDPNSATIGTAQATELIQGPLATTLPVVLTCDCNATPASATYQVLTGAGLKDLLAASPNRRARVHLLRKPHPAQRHIYPGVADRLHLQPRRRPHRRRRPDRRRRPRGPHQAVGVLALRPCRPARRTPAKLTARTHISRLRRCLPRPQPAPATTCGPAAGQPADPIHQETTMDHIDRIRRALAMLTRHAGALPAHPVALPTGPDQPPTAARPRPGGCARGAPPTLVPPRGRCGRRRAGRQRGNSGVEARACRA